MKKSLVRHLLTALGTIGMMTGLSKVVPIINYIGDNLDTVWAAGSTLGGFALYLFGFFRNSERLSN
ncbi:MAG: hypothetical protein IPO85_12445 [Saprospiraceae bacterium]|uniref:Uncharacterized protein n=1 Tax=Candidatus Defluviibacterium haderslevense TaxID=2981993 RepID=A0A9D7SAW0_9BACT|nr:hypothetical protein [Candidatus Defluviibacterium haderslevense]